jgi:uridylate kinase
MKVVVSIGGSVLAPDLEPGRVRAFADAIEGLVADGHEVAAVVGGGRVAREYIGAARELGANEIQLDDLGIAVTRLNARLLITALGETAAPAPAEDYETAGAALRRGDVAVMGGVVAAQTTDAVSAALAEYTDADLLVYATNVSGVYDADPSEHPDATQYDDISADDLVSLVAGMEMNAGVNAPVDLLATKLIQRASLRTVVMDGTDPEAVAEAIRTGSHAGTDVIPKDAGARPAEWDQ